jgi:hypothetical protein
LKHNAIQAHNFFRNITLLINVVIA